MTEQNQQAAFIKEPNVTNQSQNTVNNNAENMEVTVENENLKENLLEENKNSDENKSDMDPINDTASSTPSASENVNRKVTMEEENSEESLLKDNNKSDENKSDMNPINDTASSISSVGENINRKVTMEEENSEESSLKDNKISDEKTNDMNSNKDATSTSEAVDIVIPPKKKKKKKKKKKSDADDGLDFFDSGPRDDDEDKLYDPAKPLTFRVEVAVQKYKKNRKFNSTRNQVFNSYLRFGGISTGPKSFLGQDGLDNADADAEEIAARRATDFVDDDKVDDMEVNFTYIVRVYLSSYLIDKSGYVQMDQFREGPQVVISFLNYLFNHKVCPEYEDDMKTALEFAHKAKEELPNCKALAQNAPGKFNKACSLLFGGELYGILDDPWNGEEKVAMMIGISKTEGKRIINEVFGANANEELTRVEEDSRNALTCEIIEVESFQSEASTSETNQNNNGENSAANSESHSNDKGENSAVNSESHSNDKGENSAVNSESHSNDKGENSAVNSESHSNDKGENSAANSESHSNNNTQEIKLMKITLREYDVDNAEPFFLRVSSDVGNYAMLGMRITADFHKLSNGFWYWDKVTNVYPSYYQPCEDDSDDDD